MFLRNGHPFDDSRLQTERSDDISLLLVKRYKTLSKLEKVTKFYGGAAALVTHLFDVDQSIDCLHCTIFGWERLARLPYGCTLGWKKIRQKKVRSNITYLI